MSAPYRWNVSDFAVGYDAAAEHVHPHYRELQGVVLDALEWPADEPGLLVDAGGGSGRLAERFLDRWPQASAWIVDQSEPFLALAERRLARFGERGVCRLARLQDDWTADLPAAPRAVVSMSAIHHLDRGEKRDLYRRCAAALAPGGWLLNADEVRPAADAAYFLELQRWADHLRRGMADGRIASPLHPILYGWMERNIAGFTQPRRSGDDCHETAEEQVAALREAGLVRGGCLWRREMWAVLAGRRPAG